MAIAAVGGPGLVGQDKGVALSLWVGQGGWTLKGRRRLAAVQEQSHCRVGEHGPWLWTAVCTQACFTDEREAVPVTLSRSGLFLPLLMESLHRLT